MNIQKREVAKACGVNERKVYRDVERGALDLEDVLSVSRYIIGHIIIGDKPLQSRPEPQIKPVPIEDVIPRYTALEQAWIARRMKTYNCSLGSAESEILAARDYFGVDPLGEEQLNQML